MNALTRAGKPAAMGYAVLAYSVFVGTTGWAIGFLADVHVLPVVDGPGRRTAWAAVLIDAALLLLFAVQHTVMARAGFKRRLARLLPPAAERSTYVLAASLALILLFWQWQPLPALIWRVTAEPWVALAWSVYAIGWLVALASTFMIDHLDFLGLKQAGWQRGEGPYQPPAFTGRLLYGWVRHPMMTGLVVAFWATPVMTAGHLFFAAAGTAYIAVGVRFEERDLRRQLGDTYRQYANRVPAFVPARGRSGSAGRQGRVAAPR